MITGALLGVGVLAAFTLPFLRDGSTSVAPAAIAAPLAPGAGPAQIAASRP
ncbi:hypothetical protein [Methylobacterium dankookense]|nr:hypothetical protein [Methylobacterium dankookense]